MKERTPSSELLWGYVQNRNRYRDSEEALWSKIIGCFTRGILQPFSFHFKHYYWHVMILRLIQVLGNRSRHLLIYNITVLLVIKARKFFWSSYSCGLAGIHTLIAQSLRALAQYLFVMWVTPKICPLCMDICNMFAKHYALLLVILCPRPFCFSLWKKQTFSLGIILLVSGLNFICSSWPHGSLFALIFSNTISFISCVRVKPESERLTERNKRKYIHNFPRATCVRLFVHVQTT